MTSLDPKESPQRNIPLAERMRPRKLDDFVGQEHLLGQGKILRQLIQLEHLPSLILWGPPGVGKTTLARIISQTTGADFVFFSAVLSGIKEIRQIIEQARITLEERERQTILFVDEIHRFNKSQQDGFLPHVENGTITLIGATTENPSFQVIAPLLSRCRVLVLHSLSTGDLTKIIQRACNSPAHSVKIHPTAVNHLVRIADGDARKALNSLEIAISLAGTDRETIDLELVEEALQRDSLRYDQTGEEHYNLISALHKSLRDSDPDGALYWLTRMLKAGEEPLYILRRLIRFATEDIGNADPQALTTALNAQDSFKTLGSPEGELAIAQAAIYLATAPKSNATYAAFKKVSREIERTGSLPVPMHLRNAPSGLMKKLGYGKGYKYAHDHADGIVFQEHLPDEISGKIFYSPTSRGHEAIIADRLIKWRKILKHRQSTQQPDTKENLKNA